MIHKLKTYDDPTLDLQIRQLCEWTKRPNVQDRGEGIVLKTPDGTKQYKITISNAGAITATLI